MYFPFNRIRNSSVSIVIMLKSGRPRNRFDSRREQGLSSLRSRPALEPLPYVLWVPRFPFPYNSSWAVTLTSHLYPVPKLRISGALPPLHLFVSTRQTSEDQNPSIRNLIRASNHCTETFRCHRTCGAHVVPGINYHEYSVGFDMRNNPVVDIC